MKFKYISVSMMTKNSCHKRRLEIDTVNNFENLKKISLNESSLVVYYRDIYQKLTSSLVFFASFPSCNT